MVRLFHGAAVAVPLLCIFLICGSLSQLPSATAYSSTPGALVVLGTSISDNGNVFKGSNGTTPPPQFGYFQGRFSNGPVWVEQLAKKANLFLVDLAFGGAGVCIDGNTLGADGKPVPVPSVPQQLQLYLKNATAATLQSALHIIEGGPNDYFQYLSLVELGRVDPKKTPVDPKKIVGCIEQTARTLLEKGVTKLAIPNMLDLALIPEFNPKVNASVAPTAALISPVIAAHNQILAATIIKLSSEYPKAKVTVLDFAGVGNAIVRDFRRLYFLNAFESIQTGFVDGPNGRPIPTILKPIPEKLVWFDRVHPSAKSHRIIGNTAYKMLLRKKICSSNRR